METLVASIVGTLLFTLGCVGWNQAVQSTRITQCAANLRHIHQAMLVYATEFQAFPILQENQTLRESLKPWVGNAAGLFHCPQDRSSAPDSYSYFYAPRSYEAESDSYVLGCPRHQKYSRGIAVFAGNHTEVSRAPAILHNGQPVLPGKEFDYGTFHFADGSEVIISNGSSGNPSNGNGQDLPTISTLISYRKADGTHHTIVKMKDDHHGTANFSIVPGNQFEVVTPSGIITVRGTQFSVTTLQQGGKPTTRVQLTSGIVDLEPVSKGRPIRLTPVPGRNKGIVAQGDAPQYE